VTLLQILVVLAVVAAVAAVAAGVWRGGPVDAHDTADTLGLPEPTTTVPPVELPVDRFTADDVDGLHFSLGLRGYRMDEVDQVLDRVSAELRARDAEVAQLREQAAGWIASGGATAATDGDDTDADDADDADDASDDDAAEDSVVASTEGSVAGFGGFGTTRDRAAAPDAREP
jgi:DivIVA domain-containing protein